MELDPDFSEFIGCCVAHDVRFLVVGGYALAAHGHPRFTKDLDVWLWIDPDNARRLVAALTDFGFGSLGLTEADFVWPDRVGIDIGGLTVPFIDVAHLMVNKRAAGRLQDLADVEALSGGAGRPEA